MRFPPIVDVPIETIVGIDFSGAAQSGKTAWAAELKLADPCRPRCDLPRFRLVSLLPLGKLAGGDDRDAVNRYLVDRINASNATFWGCDFPFGLPVELPLGSWRDQLSHVRTFSGAAKEFGISLVEMSERKLGVKHVRRKTDLETQTPFDCYHYRIIYQTFHGMRDVLGKIATRPQTGVLPFQYKKLSRGGVQSIVVEACPSSTLKRSGLPYQRYKQSGGKPPSDVHRKNRRTILRWVQSHVDLSTHRRRLIMDDPGGDALDAVLAGLGAWIGFSLADHEAIASHDRYRHEGFVYC